MESTLQKPALVAAKTTSTAKTIVYWIVTGLFCLEMSFTAYYMLLRLPEGAQAITRLGFPAYFRVELAWSKLLGAVLPVWSHGGIVSTGETYKNVVKMTFAKGSALKDPSGLFNFSLDGNVRRAIDIHEGDKVDEAA